MRVCILLAKYQESTTELDALQGSIPRPEYLVLKEALGADLFDYSDVDASTHSLVVNARKRGQRFGLAMLGMLHRKRYDHFYCTGEDIALPFAMMMTTACDFGRITAVIHNAGTPRRRVMMRAVPSIAWRNIICIGDEQFKVVVEGNHVPAELVHRLPFWVDTRFYDSSRAEPITSEPFVFACGRESRDYPTLQRAAEGSQLPFRVVASGWAPHAGFAVADSITAASNLTVVAGKLSYVDLRAHYAAARVVAVPVERATYGAGVTSIVEAMCMQKPVVVTASEGIIDYVEHGVNGLIVPVGDAAAMRHALEELFADPDRAAELGANGRREMVQHERVEMHAARVAGLFGMTPLIGPLQTEPTT